MDPNRASNVGEEVGVLYQLTKPQFTVTPTPATDTTAAKFTLNVEHVTDPDQLYGLRVRPGTMSEVDLEVALSGTGGLNSLSVESREQVTPAIKAVGDFATSILGAATSLIGVGLLTTTEEQQALTSTREELLTRLGERRDAAQKQDYKDAANAIIARVKAAATADTPDPRAALIEALRPQSTLDTNVLKDVADASKTPTRPPAAPVPGPTESKAQYAAAQNLGRPANETGDVPPAVVREWNLVLGEVAYAVERQDLVHLSRLGGRVADPHPDVPETWRSHLETKASDLATRGRTFVLASTAFPDLLARFIGDRPSKPRLAALTRLQKEIADKETQWILDEQNRPTIEKELEQLQKKKHALIGATAEFAAIQALTALLQSGPPDVNQVGQGSPMGEYATLRDQLAKLQEDVTKKLAQVVKDAADPAEPKKPTWEPGGSNEVAYLWNAAREKTEDAPGAAPPPRIIRKANTKPDDSESIAARVAMDRGGNPKVWPKFVVKIKEW